MPAKHVRCRKATPIALLRKMAPDMRHARKSSRASSSTDPARIDVDERNDADDDNGASHITIDDDSQMFFHAVSSTGTAVTSKICLDVAKSEAPVRAPVSERSGSSKTVSCVGHAKKHPEASLSLAEDPAVRPTAESQRSP